MIDTTDRIYYLKAATFPEMSRWISALRRQSKLEEENELLDDIQLDIEDYEFAKATAHEGFVEKLRDFNLVMSLADAKEDFAQFLDEHETGHIMGCFEPCRRFLEKEISMARHFSYMEPFRNDASRSEWRGIQQRYVDDVVTFILRVQSILSLSIYIYIYISFIYSSSSLTHPHSPLHFCASPSLLVTHRSELEGLKKARLCDDEASYTAIVKPIYTRLREELETDYFEKYIRSKNFQHFLVVADTPREFVDVVLKKEKEEAKRREEEMESMSLPRPSPTLSDKFSGNSLASPTTASLLFGTSTIDQLTHSSRESDLFGEEKSVEPDSAKALSKRHVSSRSDISSKKKEVEEEEDEDDIFPVPSRSRSTSIRPTDQQRRASAVVMQESQGMSLDLDLGEEVDIDALTEGLVPMSVDTATKPSNASGASAADSNGSNMKQGPNKDIPSSLKKRHAWKSSTLFDDGDEEEEEEENESFFGDSASHKNRGGLFVSDNNEFGDDDENELFGKEIQVSSRRGQSDMFGSASDAVDNQWE